MKKSNINILLVALASSVALAACDSGSSPTPTPTPTPTPAPTPTPTPPAPTPTPAADESGFAALGTAPFTMAYSTAPSTGVYTQYVSGDNATLNAIAAGTKNAVALDGANKTILVSNAAGGQWTPTTLSGVNLTITSQVVYGNPSAAAGIYLIYNGISNAISVSTNGDSATPTWSTINLPNINGVNSISFVNDQFVLLANTAISNQVAVYTSTNGTTWTLENTALAAPGLTNVTQVAYVNGAYVFVAGNYANGSAIYTTTSLAANPAATSITATATRTMTVLPSGTNLIVSTLTPSLRGNSVSTSTYPVSTAGVVGPANAGPVVGALSTGTLTDVIGNLMLVDGVYYLPISTAAGSGFGTISLNTLDLATGAVTPTLGTSPAGINGVANVAGVGVVTVGAVAANSGNINVYAPATSAKWNKLASGSAVFAGFASNGSTYLAVASDGSVVKSTPTEWAASNTITTATGAQVNVSGLVYGSGAFVAFNANSQVAYFSTDVGVTWNVATLPARPVGVGSTGVQGLTYQAGKFVLTNGTSVYTASAIDGTWFTQDSTNFPASIFTFAGVSYAFNPLGTAFESNTAALTSAWSPTTDLPVDIILTGGLGYNGTTYAGFAANSSSLYTTSSIVNGSWTTNPVTFAAVTIGAINYTNPQFNSGGLHYSGKVWGAIAGGIAPSRFQGIYTSASGTSWSTSPNAVILPGAGAAPVNTVSAFVRF